MNVVREPDDRPGDLLRRQRAALGGTPFITYRDACGEQHIAMLRDGQSAAVGRGAACDLRLTWDERVSRIHAIIESMGGEWWVADKGLSRNGTYLNGDRIAGRLRLHANDEIVVGQTRLVFRSPAQSVTGTARATAPLLLADVPAAELRVLTALCRPMLGSVGTTPPASNDTIAAELGIGLASVKGALRKLYARFGLSALAQHNKRTELARKAIEMGFVRPGHPRT